MSNGKLGNIEEYSIEQVKQGLGQNGIYLIDVRNHNERLNPGRIPGSLHIPRKLYILRKQSIAALQPY